jgi:hypothetical protein
MSAFLSHKSTDEQASTNARVQTQEYKREHVGIGNRERSISYSHTVSDLHTASYPYAVYCYVYGNKEQPQLPNALLRWSKSIAA